MTQYSYEERDSAVDRASETAHRHRYRVGKRTVLATTLVGLVALLAAPASNAADLTGKWRILHLNGAVEFVDVVDVAGAVSMTLNSDPYTGTLSGSTLTLTGTGGEFRSIDATMLTGDDWFDGTLVGDFQTPPFGFRIIGSRCECYDGNLADGDGCDASCRLEPCFTCTGTPSSCTPTADGGSCSDASACTTADTCTAGICSGTPVEPCVDLTGLWDVTEDAIGFPNFESVAEIEQRDTIVLIRSSGPLGIGRLGTIVPETGEFNLGRSPGILYCRTAYDQWNGTASLDSQTYSGSGYYTSGTPTACPEFEFTTTATRQSPTPAPALSTFGAIALVTLLALSTVLMVRRAESQ